MRACDGKAAVCMRGHLPEFVASKKRCYVANKTLATVAVVARTGTDEFMDWDIGQTKYQDSITKAYGLSIHRTTIRATPPRGDSSRSKWPASPVCAEVGELIFAIVPTLELGQCVDAEMGDRGISAVCNASCGLPALWSESGVGALGTG
jgi:hypothetical protein